MRELQKNFKLQMYQPLDESLGHAIENWSQDRNINAMKKRLVTSEKKLVSQFACNIRVIADTSSNLPVSMSNCCNKI